MTTAEAWVGIWEASENQYIGAILSCRVPKTLNTIWDIEYKLNTGVESTSQKLAAKDGKADKESVSTGG